MSTINDPRIQVLKETYHAMGPAQTREVYDLKGKRYYSEQEVIDGAADVATQFDWHVMNLDMDRKFEECSNKEITPCK